MKLLYLGSKKKNNSGKELNKIEVIIAERKCKLNSLEIKAQNVQRKLNNMKQVQMEC